MPLRREREVAHPFRLERARRRPDPPGELLSGRSHSRWGELLYISGGISPWTTLLFPNVARPLMRNSIRKLRSAQYCLEEDNVIKDAGSREIAELGVVSNYGRIGRSKRVCAHIPRRGQTRVSATWRISQTQKG